MTPNGWLQIALMFALVIATARPLGIYMASVFEGRTTLLDRALRPLEQRFYALAGIDSNREQDWLGYTLALLVFNTAGFVLLYAILRLHTSMPAANTSSTSCQRFGKVAEIAQVRLGDLEIDHAQHRVTLAGQEVKLTRKEFDLLAFLGRNAGKVITHKQILNAVWGPAHTEDTQYLRVYIQHLRRKIEANPNEPKLIHTETGIGYRIAESD